MLTEITYRSAPEHDATVISKTFWNITNLGSSEAITSGQYAHIFYGLEELLFHRLQRKGESDIYRSDLSALFEQIQLSEALGKNVNMFSCCMRTTHVLNKYQV